MARAAGPTTSKARAGRKTSERSGEGSARTAKKSASTVAAPKRSARARKGTAKERSAAKRPASTAQGRRGRPPSENWATNVGLLLGTQVGREILADVLNAAA